MVEKLRRKFILLSVLSVSVVLSVIASFLNLSNYVQVGRHADELLSVLSENDGHFPKGNPRGLDYQLPQKLSPEAPFSTRFFTVKTDQANRLALIDIGKISSISSQDATHYADEVLQNGRTSGFIGNYKYYAAQKSYGTLLIFVDCSRDLQMFRSFLRNSVFIVLLGISAVSILALIFSKKAIAPVAESYKKQTQFITDANHELKTPLAIIGASTEVLELNHGKNEWTRSIRNQVEKLSSLVSNLVSLTRMDEEKTELLKTDFSISDAVWETTEPFQALAQSKGFTLLCTIEKNLSYFGDEQAIRQLVGILLDNAVHYAMEGSSIQLSLSKQGKKYSLQTRNEASGLNDGKYDILFERFYRTDRARNSQSGGYGIGLSIAKAIVLKHKGSIHAESPDGKIIVFSVLL